MKATRALIPMVVAQTCIAALSHAQSPNMIGSWKVDITFTNGESRSLRFDAQGEGERHFPAAGPEVERVGARQAFGGKVDRRRRKPGDVFRASGVYARQRRARRGNASVQGKV